MSLALSGFGTGSDADVFSGLSLVVRYGETVRGAGGPGLYPWSWRKDGLHSGAGTVGRKCFSTSRLAQTADETKHKTR